MADLVAIHQPNFFPWLGYFDKIARSDVFVFLDDVQFPKKGASWTNRVALMVGGEARWITGAIDRSYSGTRTIKEMRFLDTPPWRDKVCRTIETNYRRHAFFAETMEVIEPLIRNGEADVASYNCHAVAEICRYIGLGTSRFRWSSRMAKTGASNEMLATLTLDAGGDTYLCGGGADGYTDLEVYRAHRVGVAFQAFRHPEYPQANAQAFVPGLSVIDAAMNLGWAGVRTLIGEAPHAAA